MRSMARAITTRDASVRTRRRVGNGSPKSSRPATHQASHASASSPWTWVGSDRRSWAASSPGAGSSGARPTSERSARSTSPRLVSCGPMPVGAERGAVLGGTVVPSGWGCWGPAISGRFGGKGSSLGGSMLRYTKVPERRSPPVLRRKVTPSLAFRAWPTPRSSRKNCAHGSRCGSGRSRSGGRSRSHSSRLSPV